MFELQLGMPWTAGDSDLFHTGDEFLPGRTYEPTPSPTYLVLNSNNYNGRYTGFSITDIDSDSDAPYIWATLSDSSWSAPVQPDQEVNENNGSWKCSTSSAGADISGILPLLIPFLFALFVRRRLFS